MIEAGTRRQPSRQPENWSRLEDVHSLKQAIEPDTTDAEPARCKDGRPITSEHNTMKFRPLHDGVALRRLASESKTSGGIIIPDTAAEKPQEGEVIAVGPGARGEDGKIVAMDLKKGDRVLFGKWSGTEVKIDGAELLIMKESDIMGVLAN